MFFTSTNFAPKESEFTGTLSAAIKRTLFGPRNLKTYDDWGEKIFVYGNEFGPTIVVRAFHFEEAYDIARAETGWDYEPEDGETESDFEELMNSGQVYVTGCGRTLTEEPYEWMHTLDEWNSTIRDEDRVVAIFSVE